MIHEVSLREKIGQLMVFGFKADTAADVSVEIKELIRNNHIGGIILFGRNIGSPAEILKVTKELQQTAKESGHVQPLLICIDQENGVVRRLGEGTTVFPGAMLIGATHQPENAYSMGLATGRELKALGINWNLAPTVDVNNNPLNPVIGVRSYGESPDHVSAFGIAAMKGMQDAGVITSLKHFPGHGDTDLDSHLELPTITHDINRLHEVELVPFKECIAEGADTVMSAHVYFPAIEKRDGVPATLSKAVITGLLRDTLGFQGVVTTDCMEMKAIADTIGTPRGAVEAIKAGVDLIMISHLHNIQRETIETIVQAVEQGEIKEKTINEAYQRVMKLKSKYLSWEDLSLTDEDIQVPSVVGCEEHSKQADEVIRKGITIVKNLHQTLPLSNQDSHRVLVVYPTNSYLTWVEDERYSSNALGQVIQEIHPSAEVSTISSNPEDEEIKQVIKKAEDFDTVIVGTLTATKGSKQIKLIENLHQIGKVTVVIAMRSPYDIAYLPNVTAYMATYEFTTPALRMAAKAVYGLIKVEGELPVTIPTVN
jgi:beta-N-acetylhexosaminidase